MEHPRRRWLIALFAAALFCGAIWSLLPAREPRYHGQPLSHWLYAPPAHRNMAFSGVAWGPGSSRAFSDHLPTVSGENELTDDSRKAIESAGAEAIPTLLRMLRARDSDLKLKLLNLANKQHFYRIKYTPAVYLNFRAREGFSVLGARASNAVPALIQICDENISSASHLYALDSLGWIGPAASNAIPALLRGLKSTNTLDPGMFFWFLKGTGADKITALWSLGMIHQRPELVIPALFKALQDPDANIHQQVAVALSAYGPEARAAVEPFIPTVKEVDRLSRLDVFFALITIAPDLAAQLPDAKRVVEARADALYNGVYSKPETEQIGPGMVASLGALHIMPETVVPALTMALQGHSINIRREAANALAKFGPEARPAIPALQQALNDTNQDSNGIPVSVFAARALKIIDAASAANVNSDGPGKP